MSQIPIPTLSTSPGDFRITIEGDRAKTFFQALHTVLEANESLMASADKFPDVDYSGQEIHPQIAVEGYTRLMQERLELMMAILDDEEAGSF